MPSDRDTLLGMGFDPARVDWAMKATSGRGLQPAMDHLFENEGKPIPEASNQSTTTQGSGSGSSMNVNDDEDDIMQGLMEKGETTPADMEAKSIKCSECGKIFKNTALANYHATKSGHDQFEESTEEIKPLTEEEKVAKLEELRKKMAEKKKLKAIEDLKEQKVSENLRRKSGKEQLQFKTDLENKQKIKEAEQKKRDKIEDEKYKAKVKAQIEIDKRERAERTAREKALREGRPIVDNMADQPPIATTPAPAPVQSIVAGKDFKETRLQIRLSSGGQPLVTTLPSDAPLQAVAEYLASQNLNFDTESISFSQHFPRKVFSRTDFSKSLRELGLTPSAVLIASTI